MLPYHACYCFCPLFKHFFKRVGILFLQAELLQAPYPSLTSLPPLHNCHFIHYLSCPPLPALSSCHPSPPLLWTPASFCQLATPPPPFHFSHQAPPSTPATSSTPLLPPHYQHSPAAILPHLSYGPLSPSADWLPLLPPPPLQHHITLPIKPSSPSPLPTILQTLTAHQTCTQ